MGILESLFGPKASKEVERVLRWRFRRLRPGRCQDGVGQYPRVPRGAGTAKQLRPLGLEARWAQTPHLSRQGRWLQTAQEYSHRAQWELVIAGDGCVIAEQAVATATHPGGCSRTERCVLNCLRDPTRSTRRARCAVQPGEDR